MKNKITKQNDDFAKWYQDICEQAKLITYSPIKGTVIFEPYSYAIWENIQLYLNKEFKNYRTQNLYMPTLIPMSFLQKEKKHIKGFAPELFTVNQIGDKKINDPYIIRPTSETMFAYYFKHRIQSYKQLPMVLNQWCSVMRYENNTKPFLRTSEFLWQEGHTAHNNEVEAKKMSQDIWKVYDDFINNQLLISTIKGLKTETEKFAGAEETYTIETIMKDGQALQSCTSHYLGQNFSKGFDIQFQNKNNKNDYVFQTSWGMSTRIIGAIIMNHGDDKGLVLPPDIAPYQIVLMGLFMDKNPNIKKALEEINSKLKKEFRTFIDFSDKSIGFKSQEWESKGVPIRIEVGPRDVENRNIVIVNRVNGNKIESKIEDVLSTSQKMIKDIKEEMLKNSKMNLKNKMVKVTNFNDFKDAINNKKVVEVSFNWTKELEKEIKDKTGATTRCVISNTSKDKCFYTNKQSNMKVIFARAY